MKAGASQFKHLFGPVASRRLGRSLGVDLLPFKTCTLDCVYCECGGTTRRTLQRREYVPAAEILAELRQWHAGGGAADVITIAGSGEPTLHTRFGEIIVAAKQIVAAPVCLLTNGTLFYLPEVRHAAAAADVVVPSLDAPDQAVFERINRPCAALTFETYYQGLQAFAQEYHGRLWLEIFLVPGINDERAIVAAMAQLVAKLKPEKVQLNTAVRPPAESFVKPLAPHALEELAALFTPRAEVIAAFDKATLQQSHCTATDVLRLLQRRPCPLEEIASGLSAPAAEVQALLDALLAEGRVTKETLNGQVFFRAARG